MRHVFVPALLALAALVSPLSASSAHAEPIAVVIDGAKLEAFGVRINQFAGTLAPAELAVWNRILRRAASVPAEAQRVVAVARTLTVDEAAVLRRPRGPSDNPEEDGLIAIEGAIRRAIGDTRGLIGPKPEDPAALIGPKPEDPAALIGPKPEDPAALIGPKPEDPAALIGPKPEDPAALIGPKPEDPAALIGPKPEDPAPRPDLLAIRFRDAARRFSVEERAMFDWLLQRAARAVEVAPAAASRPGSPGGAKPVRPTLGTALGAQALIGPKPEDPGTPHPTRQFELSL